MNVYFGIGNLGADPTLRETNSGTPVANFSIAVDKRYTTGVGTARRTVVRTEWIPVVCWGVLAETCAAYLKKGSKVAVQGEPRSRTNQLQDGTRYHVLEIHADDVQFLDKIRSNDEVRAYESEVITDPEQGI